MSAYLEPTSGYHRQPFASMTGGTGNGYTDDDLLASLAGFAVEGQTERDLATIKAMLHSAATDPTASGYTRRREPPTNFGWHIQPIPFQQHQCMNNPPPNTPTLSKSMDLLGTSASGYSESHYFSSRIGASGPNSQRRDVSLDRSYTSGVSATSHMDATMHESEESGPEQSTSSNPFGNLVRPVQEPSSCLVDDGPGKNSREEITIGIAPEQAYQRETGGMTTGELAPNGLPGGDEPSHILPSPFPPVSMSSSPPTRSTVGKRRHKTPPSSLTAPHTRSRARQHATSASIAAKTPPILSNGFY